MLGTCSELQRTEARMDGRDWRLPERGWNLHRLHNAGLPRQVHAVHGCAAGIARVGGNDRPLRKDDSRAAFDYQHHGEQRTEMAAPRQPTYYGLSPADLLRRIEKIWLLHRKRSRI